MGVDQHAFGLLPGTIAVDSCPRFARGLHPPLGYETGIKNPEAEGPNLEKQQVDDQKGVTQLARVRGASP